MCGGDGSHTKGEQSEQRDEDEICHQRRAGLDILIKALEGLGGVTTAATSTPLEREGAGQRENRRKEMAGEAEKRFDDIFHVTSMMPIIFLTFSAEASLLALGEKKMF
jgi:hypothetical protein